MSETKHLDSGHQVTPAELLRVAKLVRINVDQDKIGKYCGELSDVISWFCVLSEVDTTGVDPMRYGWSVTQKHLQTRVDAVTEGNIKDKILSSSVSSAMGCFTVKKVV